MVNWTVQMVGGSDGADKIGLPFLIKRDPMGKVRIVEGWKGHLGAGRGCVSLTGGQVE